MLPLQTHDALISDAVKLSKAGKPVLITGETGTGKTSAAMAVHERCQRDGKFISTNIASLPAELIESELFGHAKGAFTGATRSHIGIIERAEDGTLFLDEITRVPIRVQTKLLRAFDEGGDFTPVGGSKPKLTKCALICATSQNIRDLIEHGLFLRDLYWRLAGAIITR